MALEFQIGLAVILDQLFGDPRWLPHPVRLLGKLALLVEKICRASLTHKKTAGVLTVIIVLLAAGFATAGLLHGLGLLNPALQIIAAVILLYTCLAAKDLAVHSRAVFQALNRNNLELARKRVAMMVGRDTANLDEAGITRACIESVAENIVDGVTAPLFYAALAGPVGALLYKAVNTMDSTFGYKNDQYREFGWGAARLDDLANFLPARITGLIIVIAASVLRLDGRQTWQIFKRDRLAHASPNSGHSEAAVAGALGLQMGGPNFYFGSLVHKPTIGDPEHPPRAQHIQLANRLLLVTTLLAGLLFILVRLAVTFNGGTTLTLN